MPWSKFVERYTPFLCRHHLAFILVGMLITLGAGYFVSKLRIQSDLGSMLPEHFPSVRTLEQIREKYGGVGNVRVLATSDHLDSAKAFVVELVAALNRNPKIRYVDYRIDKEFFRKHSLLFMAQEDLEEIRDRISFRINREKIKQSPLYIDLEDEEETEDEPFDISDIEDKYKDKTERDEFYVSPDKHTVALDIYPAGTSSNIGFVREIVAEVQRIVAEVDPSRFDPRMEIEYAGQFQNRINEDRIVREDVFGTLLYGLVAVILLVSIYFRQPLAAFFLGIPLIMGLLWTFGITYIVIGSLNLITAFLFVVLFGLSIEFGVHLFYRYLECRREGADVEAALRLVLERTGKAMLTSGATTATAFFSLLITEFRGFSEFGFIMGLGYLLCLVSMLTLFPALLIVSERWRMIRLNNREAVARIFRNGPIPFVWGIIGVGVLFTVFSLAVLPHLPFEYDFRRLRAYVPETEKAKEKAGKIFTLAQSPVVVLAESREDMDAIVAAVHAHMAADTLSPTIDTVRTIYDELPADQDEKLFTIKEIKTLLEENDVSSFLSGEQLEKMDEFRELLEVKSIGIEDLPYGIRRRFIGTDGAVGNFVFIYPSVSLADGQQAIRFAEDVRDIPLPDGRVYHASSGDIIFADVLLVMKRDSKIAIVAAFIVVFLIVLLDFRSLRSALLVLLPLVVGIIWMCGGMVVFGMKISLFNMVVFPSIIGLSLDSGVHLYHRYLEEGPGNLWKVFLTTGQAVAVGALTTMLGFADLVLARHPGLKSLGSLAVLGLVTTLITALVLFPAALQAAERLRSRRRSS